MDSIWASSCASDKIIVNSFFRAESAALYSLFDTLAFSYSFQTASISIEPIAAAETCDPGLRGSVPLVGRRRVIRSSRAFARYDVRADSKRFGVFCIGGVCPLGSELVPECDFDLFPELVHFLGQEVEVELAQLPCHGGVIIECQSSGPGDLRERPDWQSGLSPQV